VGTKPDPTPERPASSIAKLCLRHDISMTVYRRLRAAGRGPRETRFGANVIRITPEDERDWIRQLQEGGAEFEEVAVKRALKAGDAAAKSDRHVSKRSRRSPAKHA